MSSTEEPRHLNNHHRDTLLQIFQHPAGHGVEWQRVVSLLEATGSIDRRPDGRYVVRVGNETAVFDRPRGKDIDVQQAVDLRHMLSAAGYGALVNELEGRGQEV